MRRSEPGSRRRATVLGALALLCAGTATASDGKALYAKCAPCHGAQGEGIAATGAPPLAGLDIAYLERQLVAFASGTRGAQSGDSYGAAMRAAAGAALAADSDRRAVAAFVGTLPPPRLPVAAAATANDNGRNYFNAICGACHGGRGQGNAVLGAPRLSGLPAPYLARQLAAFKSGQRGSASGDRYGNQMRSVSAMLPDAATARDVVAYAASLRP